MPARPPKHSKRSAATKPDPQAHGLKAPASALAASTLPRKAAHTRINAFVNSMGRRSQAKRDAR
jgi:hypothetical protein